MVFEPVWRKESTGTSRVGWRTKRLVVPGFARDGHMNEHVVVFAVNRSGPGQGDAVLRRGDDLGPVQASDDRGAGLGDDRDRGDTPEALDRVTGSRRQGQRDAILKDDKPPWIAPGGTVRPDRR